MLLTLTRGLGQSALSIVSLAMVGKWFRQRLSTAMGVYAVVDEHRLHDRVPRRRRRGQGEGWRLAWARIGLALVVGAGAPRVAPRSARRPRLAAWTIDGEPASGHGTRRGDQSAARWARRCAGGAFWVFALGSAFYGLVASGIGLFNESILNERGFESEIYQTTLAVTAIVGLAGNFAPARWAQRGSLRPLLVSPGPDGGGARDTAPRDAVVARHGARGRDGRGGRLRHGRVLRFWGSAYGRAHLGRIQGAAQLLTVLASAVGPLVLAQCVDWTGAYSAGFYGLALVVAALALATMVVPIPPGAQRLRAAVR